jgi:glutathione synthase/RimK-type ligase-like ATP-grasp enzyme
MPGTFDVTIATHAAMSEGSTDDRLLADAVATAGALVRFAVWSDAGVDWSRSRLTVVRSTWDYHLDPPGWFAWLDAAGSVTRLINAAPILRWNSDKRYLLELGSAGVPIVATEHVLRGAAFDLAERCRTVGWSDVVVKPAIGASAKGAARFGEEDLASSGQAHLDALLAAGDALVQPFQAAVDVERERSLVFLGGAFSHAFTKPPFLRGTGDGLGEVLHQPTAEEREVADRVFAGARVLVGGAGAVAYARVDVVPAPDGPRLMELELIEPDLGLRLQPGAPATLAAAILTK